MNRRLFDFPPGTLSAWPTSHWVKADRGKWHSVRRYSYPHRVWVETDCGRTLRWWDSYKKNSRGNLEPRCKQCRK